MRGSFIRLFANNYLWNSQSGHKNRIIPKKIEKNRLYDWNLVVLRQNDKFRNRGYYWNRYTCFWTKNSASFGVSVFFTQLPKNLKMHFSIFLHVREKTFIPEICAFLIVKSCFVNSKKQTLCIFIRKYLMCCVKTHHSTTQMFFFY